MQTHFFFFNDTATTEIYTLSLHDALPISQSTCMLFHPRIDGGIPLDSAVEPQQFRSHRHGVLRATRWFQGDRKSTRLNSSHANISYAVFCLNKKHQHHQIDSQ